MSEKKKIEVVNSYTIGYDDGSAAKRLREQFKSTVYKSLDEFSDDLRRMGKNEDYTRTWPCGELSEWSEKRSPEERSQILAEKIAAQRRFDQHYEEGGTDFYLMPSPLLDEDVHH